MSAPEPKFAWTIRDTKRRMVIAKANADDFKTMVASLSALKLPGTSPSVGKELIMIASLMVDGNQTAYTADDGSWKFSWTKLK